MAKPLFLLILVAVPAGAQQPLDLRADAQRIEARIAALSQYGRNPDGGVSRLRCVGQASGGA